ncbi:MAG: hypothetical protein GXO88_10940 [Chlorobi bacterium]|nr:hypothetical protein [Chlorobiota bacterium]
MLENLRNYYKQNPLRTILFAGLLFRFFAVLFSKGFGWIDDQFLIIEIAQSWVDKTDYYHWLPWTTGNTGPVKFSFFYTGLMFYFFKFLEFIGISNPQGKMYFVRAIHAIWSLLIIIYGYKITLKLSNPKNAKTVGWILALLWLFPFLSVRNLIEYVSIPLILWPLYLLLNNKGKLLTWLVAGFLFGLAFNIRLQTVLLTGGIGLVFLFKNRIKEVLFLALGFIASVAIFQGLVDYYFWGYPFAQLIEYVSYNMESAQSYTVGPWFVYIMFILAVLIPPYSISLMSGFLYNWKKLAVIFVPVIIFLAFHSYYPNKQERFVVTIIPLIIISGIIGWNSILDKLNSPAWEKASRISIIIFWALNTLLLLPVSFMYSKKARVESMEYLSAYKQIEYFVIEDDNRNVTRFPPMYYLDKWVNYDAIMKDVDIKKLSLEKGWDSIGRQPDFVLFYQPDNLEERVKNIQGYLPGLVYETTIEPGMADRVLHWLNPINANENIYIYRNTARIKKGIN